LQNTVRLNLAVVELVDAKRKHSGTLAAGALARWLEQYLHAQAETEPAGEVPCGECNACCKASYFIAIAEEERETLARIPRVHLTVSTRSHERQWALEQSCGGSCPMLVDETCSIYAHRPRACRRFDCRVFAAASIAPGTGPRAAVNEQVWRWRFDYPSTADASRQTAVLAAAAFLQRRADLIDPELAPTDTGELAKAAVFVHELFLQTNTHSDEHIAAALNSKLRELAAA
jgi:Fe-S-cluster containining protein